MWQVTYLGRFGGNLIAKDADICFPSPGDTGQNCCKPSCLAGCSVAERGALDEI